MPYPIAKWGKGGFEMLFTAKLLLFIAGLLLILDAYLMYAKKPNPIKGFPLPCPITLAILGLGLVLLVMGL
jgi:hypothetical protein